MDTRLDDVSDVLDVLEDRNGPTNIEDSLENFDADAIYRQDAEPDYPTAERDFERENPLDPESPVSQVQVDVPHRTIAYKMYDGMEFVIASFYEENGLIQDSNECRWVYGDGDVWWYDGEEYETESNSHISCCFENLTGPVWEDAVEVYKISRRDRAGEELKILRNGGPLPTYFEDELNKLRSEGEIDMAVETPSIPSDSRSSVGVNRARNLARVARQEGHDVAVDRTVVRLNGDED